MCRRLATARLVCMDTDGPADLLRVLQVGRGPAHLAVRSRALL